MIPGCFSNVHIFRGTRVPRRTADRYTHQDYFLLIRTAPTKVESSLHPKRVVLGLGFIVLDPTESTNSGVFSV